MASIGTLIALALVGLFIGVFSGLLGIGGGTVIVPALRVLFNCSALVATATSLFTIIPTSISGAVKHVRNKTCIPALGLAAGLGGACTSPLGVWLANQAPAWSIIVVAGIVIFYSAYNMFKKAFKAPKESLREKLAAAKAAKLAKARAAESAEGADAQAQAEAAAAAAAAEAAAKPVIEIPKLSRKQLAQGFLIGVLAGVVSGFIGVGGGFLMVPLFLSVLNIPMKLTSGTSLIAVMILATPGAIEHGLMGNIDFVASLALIVGTIPGAVLGANLSRLLPERTLRFIFAGFLLVSAAMLFVKELGLLG